MEENVRFSSVEEAIDEIKSGKFVIVVDDEDRENEGDLVISAEKVTPEAINFMAKYARGLICVPMLGARLDEMNIPQMVSPAGHHQTAFTVSVDAKKGISTGISAEDRAATVQLLVSPKAQPGDFAMPGHMFPLRYKEGGVLIRAGHTEASVDMAKMAGHYPAGVICEIMNEDGTMARVPQLQSFARQHGLKMITIESLIAYRRRTEKLIRKVAQTRLPTHFGVFELHCYESLIDGRVHMALTCGNVSEGKPVLVRVHSECLTGDVFSSKRCDCGAQLNKALSIIADEGTGCLLYIRQEGRGIGLLNKILAYSLQDQGKDTVEANEALGFPPDLRDYGTGAQILSDLGIRKLRLLTNNPRKIAGIFGHGLEVVERVALTIMPNEENQKYLKTKKEKLGHWL